MRTFVRLAGLATVALALCAAPPLPAQTTPLPRIGYVATPGVTDLEALRRLSTWKALFEGLREQGFVEGRDFVMDLRTAKSADQYAPLTRELAESRVSLLIAAVCGAPLEAARAATRTIPIVVPTCNDDLVELGIVASLNRPGGNITGLSKLTPELAPKRLQLLLEAVPRARTVAVLWNPAYSEFKADWRELRAAAGKLGVTLQPVEFRQPADLEPAFEALARQRPDALMMFSDVLTWVHAPRVAQLTRDRRLPGMFAFREVADRAGLMSYGPSIPGRWRQSARLIARILRGEKPAELPIEQPSRFELVINQQAAQELGLRLPQTLLLQADEVVP